MGHYSNYQERVAYDRVPNLLKCDAYKGVAIHYRAYGADSLIAARAAMNNPSWHFASWSPQAEACLLVAALASMPAHVVKACDRAREAGHADKARRAWRRLLAAQERRVKRQFNRHYAEQGWFNS